MKIHIIAIGGSIMHNLAMDLKNNGHTVTGSDDDIHEPSLSRLSKNNLLPEKIAWCPEKITSDIDIVILGMHARKDNPELLKAQQLNLKIYSYPEFIYQQSIHKKRVVIGGSHGKTTITSMILHVLQKNNISADYLVGAQLSNFDTMVKITNNNPYLIAEGDEYLASPIDLRPKFLIYQPHIAVISGIAWDHINVFPLYSEYKNAFVEFVKSIVSGGTLIYNSLDEEVKDVINSVNRKDIEYIPYSLPQYKIQNEKIAVQFQEKLFDITIFGKHNLQNLESAKWVCKKLGIDESDFLKSISDFTGASKRLEKWVSHNEMIIFRDFAHAPSKVKASIDAVKEVYGKMPIIAVFELHTYSSLNEKFLSEYKDVLNNAQYKIVFFDAHTLHIKKMPPLNKEKIKMAFNDHSVYVIDNKNELLQILKSIGIKNKVVLLMSSGTFSGLYKEDLINL